jgi:hypothetical protein
MTHSFETEDAEKYGVNAALILSNIRFWIAKNKANKRHEYDGKTWTYNSVKAFGELFPYLSAKQIRTEIQKLVEAGEIGEGNYNKSSYDRTKWYCLLKKIHLTKKENPFALEGKPIPDSKPYCKQDERETPSAQPSFQDPKLEHSWKEWCQHLKEKKKVPTNSARLKQIELLKKMTKEDAIATIDHSIAGGYQGLFPPDDVKNRKASYVQKPQAQRIL